MDFRAPSIFLFVQGLHYSIVFFIIVIFILRVILLKAINIRRNDKSTRKLE